MGGMTSVEATSVIDRSRPNHKTLSPEQLMKITVMIMTVCAAFGLAVTEAETEIKCLRY